MAAKKNKPKKDKDYTVIIVRHVCSLPEVDLLFNTIVLPNINYALSVYGASESDLTTVQCFLDRCFKRKYTSKTVSVYDFFERQDRKIFRKVSNAKGHPLLSIMPRVKPSSYNLRKETCFKLKINTVRFKNSFYY